MNPDLLRQRRNLILVSSGLLLFDFAKVTVTKISVLGTELLIGDVRVFVYFVWVLWGYFLLRYYQYLRAEKDLGIWAKLTPLFERRAWAYVFKKLNRTQLSGSLDFNRQGLRWTYLVKEYAPDHSSLREIEKGQIPRLKGYWWIAKSLFYVSMHTPKATDHILPFLLAIAAPIISIVKVLQANA